jgi:hypothetical protein
MSSSEWESRRPAGVLRLTAANAGSAKGMARLEDYSFGRLTVDGQEHTQDLIVLPDRVVSGWWRREGHSLAIEDLDEVLDELPAQLVLGVGAHGRLRPPRSSRSSSDVAWSNACRPTRRCTATVSSTSAAPRRRCT